jgi:hypothetical protein
MPAVSKRLTSHNEGINSLVMGKTSIGTFSIPTTHVLKARNLIKTVKVAGYRINGNKKYGKQGHINERESFSKISGQVFQIHR